MREKKQMYVFDGKQISHQAVENSWKIRLLQGGCEDFFQTGNFHDFVFETQEPLMKFY